MILNKNSRSQLISAITQSNQWNYQEFINFNDSIKSANFGVLNYSQNVIFRHFIGADDTSFGLGFNFFDCRAIEPTGIHNCSVIMFNLKPTTHVSDERFGNTLSSVGINKFSTLHASFLPITSPAFSQMSAGVDQAYFLNIIKMQKLTPLKSHFAFPQHHIFSNDPSLLESFLHEHLTNSDQNKLSTWLLAHLHLHIEISNGILLAYQPNHLLESDDIFSTIEQLADISTSLSKVQ